VEVNITTEKGAGDLLSFHLQANVEHERFIDGEGGKENVLLRDVSRVPLEARVPGQEKTSTKERIKEEAKQKGNWRRGGSRQKYWTWQGDLVTPLTRMSPLTAPKFFRPERMSSSVDLPETGSLNGRVSVKRERGTSARRADDGGDGPWLGEPTHILAG
jgi:hypothetical protein